jgi:thioredoxin reductase
MSLRCLALGVVTIALVAVALAAPSPPRHDFCIIGAGPGGLQAAASLAALRRDYVVFETGDRAGNFFRKYPRQRGLISINKVNTGTDDPEFNLRHDWNSLLDPAQMFVARNIPAVDPQAAPHVDVEGRAPLLFTNFSRTYYPKADLLVDYFEAFADRHRLNIKYSRRVSVVRRFPNDGDFDLAVDFRGSEERYHCRVVLLASGQFVPRKLVVNVDKKTKRDKRIPADGGASLVTGYHEMSVNMNDYMNKDVLILGVGNSALEIAKAMEDYAASVHIYSRRPMQMAYHTHYVGHARSVNLGVLDRYQLKSMDLFLALMPEASQLKFWFDNATQRVRVEAPFFVGGDDEDQMEQQQAMMPSKHRRNLDKFKARMVESNALRRGYHYVISCLGFSADASIFEGKAATKPPARTEADSACDGKQAACAGASHPLDVHYDPRLKRPIVASNFESVNVPDLFVAGNLMHYRDFKRGAGGFIHGFRYLARSLVWMLHERYPPAALTNTPAAPRYPSVRIAPPMQRDAPSAAVSVLVDDLVTYMLTRLLNVSSLYQMQGHLGDVYVVKHDATAPAASAGTQSVLRGSVWHIPDVPLDLCASQNPNRTLRGLRELLDAPSFITVNLEFGPHFHGLGTLHHQGQGDTLARQAETWVFHPDDDPDAQLAEKTRPPIPRKHSKPPFEVPPVEPLPPLHPPSDADFNEPDGLKEDDDGFDDSPHGKFRYQFLHPVVRLWSRTQRSLDKKPAASGGAAKLIAQLRLREEPHNQWNLPMSHEKGLREFLGTKLRALLKHAKNAS